mmetsp:Transcript_74921/g.210240  ORF Transcript_74921/g.210240 Transcript_74921/m.210240 type:complete len:85 (-) Transcript_74921:367-621(-)
MHLPFPANVLETVLCIRRGDELPSATTSIVYIVGVPTILFRYHKDFVSDLLGCWVAKWESCWWLQQQQQQAKKKAQSPMPPIHQ